MDVDEGNIQIDLKQQNTSSSKSERLLMNVKKNPQNKNSDISNLKPGNLQSNVKMIDSEL